MSDERSTYTGQNAGCTSKVRVAALARRQRACITWAQLRAVGVAEKTIRRWVAVGYLTSIHPRVYCVGPLTNDRETRLFSLVLLAGPNAALSHGTSAHWRGWLRYPVNAIHISTPRRIRTSPEGVVFHCERDIERALINGIPCTTVTQTLLDLAATEDPRLVNRSLAQLDYQRQLNRQAIKQVCGRGRPGARALLTALDSYIPQLACTKSDLEDEYLYLCQRFKIPLPQVNASVYGEEPDCYWPDLGLVVELDGGGNHHSASQRHRDQRKALTLRSHGLTVVRYTEDQVFNCADQVGSDTLAQLVQRRRLMS